MDQPLQRLLRPLIIERADAAIFAHELPAVLPAIEVEPTVAEQGNEADALEVPSLRYFVSF